MRIIVAGTEAPLTVSGPPGPADQGEQDRVGAAVISIAGLVPTVLGPCVPRRSGGFMTEPMPSM